MISYATRNQVTNGEEFKFVIVQSYSKYPPSYSCDMELQDYQISTDYERVLGKFINSLNHEGGVYQWTDEAIFYC